MATFSPSAHSIVHLTSVHPPYDTRIFFKECRSLAEAGYRVTLVAPHSCSETKNGIQIIAVKPAKLRLTRITFTVWRVYLQTLRMKPDICHFHDPELIPAAILLKLSGIKVIYDVHENVPADIMSKHWVPFWLRRPVALAAAAAEWIGARVFDAIAAATTTIAERFPAQKTITIQNFPYKTELVSLKQTAYQQKPPVFAYVGCIDAHRGAREMVRALDYLADRPGVRLELAGDFTPAGLEQELRALSAWGSVVYHGRVSRSGVAEILDRTRAGLAVFHPTPNHVDAQPTKMFEYMSAGLPVIVSDFPLWRRIVSGASCGLLVDPQNPEAIAGAMRWILEHPAEAEEMGRRGKAAVDKIYNWETESAKLLALYERLLAGELP